MTCESPEAQSHHTIVWIEGEEGHMLHIHLREDGSLSLREEGTTRDPATGEQEPWKGEMIKVPAHQIDHLVEAIVLIQVKRKELESGVKSDV